MRWGRLSPATPDWLGVSRASCLHVIGPNIVLGPDGHFRECHTLCFLCTLVPEAPHHSSTYVLRVLVKRSVEGTCTRYVEVPRTYLVHFLGINDQDSDFWQIILDITTDAMRFGFLASELQPVKKLQQPVSWSCRSRSSSTHGSKVG